MLLREPPNLPAPHSYSLLDDEEAELHQQAENEDWKLSAEEVQSTYSFFTPLTGQDFKRNVCREHSSR